MKNNPFLKLADEMELYRNERDQRLGVVIGESAHKYGLPSSTCAQLLRAVAVIAKTPARALFADAVVNTYVHLYTCPDDAINTLERIASFLATCGSLEEAELTVAKMSQIPPTDKV